MFGREIDGLFATTILMKDMSGATSKMKMKPKQSMSFITKQKLDLSITITKFYKKTEKIKSLKTWKNMRISIIMILNRFSMNHQTWDNQDMAWNNQS